jgi:GDPmannose 4,6-dehydratase
LKTALVTGITGQDGAYIARFLLSKDYRVFGSHRRSSALNFWRLRELGILEHPNLHLVEHDITDLAASIRLLGKVKPHEIYNLAAQSFVGVSFDQPYLTSQITGIGTLNMLEALRIASPESRFYQASSSEMFGLVQEVPQSETTSFYPRSPYGTAKVFAHWSTVNYRESHGLFASSGILFNHESPLRGREFVTRKISSAVARISQGSGEVLELGNLDAQRDWGYAADYVEGMWLMLQAQSPDSFVLATGQTTTVRDFVKMSFYAAGIEAIFEGNDEAEKAINSKTGQLLLRVNPQFYRPAEVELLLGDYSKAREKLKWNPSIKVEDLARMMVEADLVKIQTGQIND